MGRSGLVSLCFSDKLRDLLSQQDGDSGGCPEGAATDLGGLRAVDLFGRPGGSNNGLSGSYGMKWSSLMRPLVLSTTKIVKL